MLRLLIFVAGVVVGAFLTNPVANAIKASVKWLWKLIVAGVKKLFKIK